MLFQLRLVEEVQFLLYLTAFVLGVQLAMFFFYRYFKIKDDRLHLNKILLSFGSFFFLAIIGGLCLFISMIFISNSIMNEILLKIGYIFTFISLMSFLYFITIREFSKIINLNITRVLIVINLIPIILVSLIVSTTLTFLLLNSGFMLLNLVIITIFQIRLISSSKGNIKKRIIQLFVGISFSFFSLLIISVIASNVIKSEIIDFLLITSLFLLILGIIIALTGVYNFPAFYEFKWKENLLNLLIINRENDSCLYSHDFSELHGENQSNSNLIEGQTTEDYNKLFSGGITGIDMILSAITNTRGEKIKLIKQAGTLIFLEYSSAGSSQITYALIAKEDLSSNLYFLNSLKNQFESFYKEILKDLHNLKGNEELLFKSFKLIIDNMML